MPSEYPGAWDDDSLEPGSGSLFLFQQVSSPEFGGFMDGISSDLHEVIEQLAAV